MALVPDAYLNLPDELSESSVLPYPADGDFFPELIVIIDFTEGDGGR